MNKNLNTQVRMQFLVYASLSALPVISYAQFTQDCIHAITVCTNTYVQSQSSIGYGTQQEVLPGSTCLQNGETNSTWYLFNIDNPGTLLFQITPFNSTDDYDYVVYQFHGNCNDITNGSIPPERCNYSSTIGSTGLATGYSLTSVPASGPNQCAPLNVVHNQTFLLLINNFTSTSAGYTLTFSGTASIYDTESPSLSSIYINSCSPDWMDVYFSENINCQSIASNGSDFRITGPSTVSISSANGVSCGSGSTAPYITVHFQQPITVPGTYTVHIKQGTDTSTLGDFCDNMMPVGALMHFNVLYIAPVASIASQHNANCHNGGGKATGHVTGGTSPYSYNWNTVPVQQTLVASNLAPGTYTFTVTDAHGCSSQSSVTIISTGIPDLTIIPTPEHCDSLHSGTATAIIANGTAPFTYIWNTSPVQTTATATGLSAGYYTVLITGADSCSVSGMTLIPLDGTPQIHFDYLNVPCDGSFLGSAIAHITGGNPPYTYIWSNSATDTIINHLHTGHYTITVTDSKGCVDSSTVTISPGFMQLSINSVNLHCGNIHNGSATVSVGQAVFPVTYRWNTVPVQTTATAINLPEGIFTVKVTDATGCHDTISVHITGPPPLNPGISTISASCTFNDGIAEVIVTGGDPPYSYSWNSNPQQFTSVATNLFAGNYIVTVTDQDTCSITIPAYVSNWDGPEGFLTDLADATCKQANGSATVTGVTGQAPFSYLWYTNPLHSGATSPGLPEGLFVVKITDSRGCLTFLNVKINEIPMVETILDQKQNSACEKSDGFAIVRDSSGIPPFSYLWNTIPPQYTPAITGLTEGIYLAMITDGNGCTDSLYVTILENKAHNDFTYTTSCLTEYSLFEGSTDYSGSVTWEWDFGDTVLTGANPVEQQTTHLFSYPDIYTVTLYIEGGCATDTLIKNLAEAMKPEAEFRISPPDYYATTPVSFTYTGTPVSEYLWNFNDGIVSLEESPVHAYKNFSLFDVSLYVTDAYGCKDTIDTVITINEPPAVYFPNVFTPNDDGINDTYIIPSWGLTECTFKVFNRWGMLIYSCNDPNQMSLTGWNAVQNGKKIPEGLYTYLFSGKLINGKDVKQQGTISVIR